MKRLLLLSVALAFMTPGRFAALAQSATVRFDLNTSEQAVAVQFDVRSVSVGLSFGMPALENLSPHAVDSSTPTNNVRRFIIYSTSNSPLDPSGIITVSMHATNPATMADGMFVVENVIACNAGGTTVSGAPNARPIILSVSPSGYRSAAVGLPATLAATAIDPDGAVSSVALRINGITQGSAVARPFTALWTPSAPSTNVFDAVATGGGGSMASSAPTTLMAYTLSNLTSYAAFAQTHFGPDAGNPAIASSTSKAPGSVLPNLLAYFSGLNPWSPDLSKLLSLRRSGPNLTLRFERSDYATGVDYVLEQTDQMVPAPWPLMIGGIVESNLGNGYREVKAILQTTGNPQAYYQLQVTQTPP